MVIQAVCSFSGLVSMAKGEVREVRDDLASDLIFAGYAVVIEPGKKVVEKKAVRHRESQ